MTHQINLFLFISGFLLFTHSADAKIHRMVQLDKAFVGDVSDDEAKKMKGSAEAVKKNKVKKIEIAVGDSVHFVNLDDTTHNAYSKFFDLKQGPNEDKKPVKFEKAGKFTVRCAIHPKMKVKVIVK